MDTQTQKAIQIMAEEATKQTKILNDLSIKMDKLIVCSKALIEKIEGI